MQRRVVHVLDLEVVQVTLRQVRVEVQRPQPQRGGRAEVTAFEVRPRLRRVKWRDVDEQVHAALDLGEPGVDLECGRQLLGR